MKRWIINFCLSDMLLSIGLGTQPKPVAAFGSTIIYLKLVLIAIRYTSTTMVGPSRKQPIRWLPAIPCLYVREFIMSAYTFLIRWALPLST